MSFDRMLVHSATIKRPDPTTTVRYRVSYVTIATGVPCRLVPIDGSTVKTVLGSMDKATHVLYFKGGQEIGQNYIVEVSGFSGVEFRVVEDLRAYKTTASSHHIECLVEERLDAE